MTTVEIDVAIAKFCGWEVLPPREGDSNLMGRKTGTDWTILPKYHRDLNGIYLAEEELIEKNAGEYWDYIQKLKSVVNEESTVVRGCVQGITFHATAYQKAKALMMAQKLWKTKT